MKDDSLSQRWLTKHLIIVVLVKLALILVIKWLFFPASPEGVAPDWFSAGQENHPYQVLIKEPT